MGNTTSTPVGTVFTTLILYLAPHTVPATDHGEGLLVPRRENTASQPTPYRSYLRSGSGAKVSTSLHLNEPNTTTTATTRIPGYTPGTRLSSPFPPTPQGPFLRGYAKHVVLRELSTSSETYFRTLMHTVNEKLHAYNHTF